MNEELERILGEALDLLEQGVAVEAIVARHPAHAAELRPFLLTATQLARLSTQPSLTAEQRSKRAFLAAAAAPAARRAPAGGRLARLFAPALAVLLIFLLGSAALVGASAAAVPGSTLYETKRLVESLRLGLAADPERAAVLRERFRQERLAEVEQLLANGRAADVTFVGTLSSSDGPRWTVDGLPVDVAEAVIEGTPRVGALVEINGRVVDSTVRAARVVVLSSGLPEATPLPPTPPAAEETYDAGAAEAATVTPTPTATLTPPPTSASTAPAAATAPATAAATIPPSATPGDDNANDNDAPPLPSATPGDNNGNDNDDNSNDNEAPTPPTDPTPDDDNNNVNDNDNDNDNANSNDNDNANSNDNDNANDNDNDNDNDNANDNDDNSNDNDNANNNDDNSNDNDNDNSNDSGDNGNDNGNENDNGD